MSAPIKTAALLLGGVGVAACSLSGLTFDLAGPGGAAATSSSTATSSGGSDATASSSSTGTPSVCGDGVVESNEECDDDNVAPGDGCSPTCTLEANDACPGALIPLTPSGLTINGTLADKAPDLAPSCGTADAADVVYAVVPSVGGTLAAQLTGAGKQGSISIRSRCNDSFTGELACKQGSSPTAQVWVQPGVTYWVVASGSSAPFTLDLKLFTCGDGQVQGLEQCDNPADTKCLGCTKCNNDGELRDSTSKHCYLVSPLPQKSWSAARAACIAWGGDLAALRSQAELDFIKGKFPFGNTWIGGTDFANECSFSWTNGEPWHAKWESGQPDNADGTEDCVVLSANGTMNDLPCSNSAGYICERTPAGSCGDGVLQPGEECDDAIASTTFDCAGCKLACKAGEFEDPATRHCYRVVPTHVTPSNAASACAALGAYVAAINTPAENALIEANLTEATWIGLGAASPSTASWSNSDPTCFLNFKSAMGSTKLCTTMSTDGTWANASCNASRAYVCERDN